MSRVYSLYLCIFLARQLHGAKLTSDESSSTLVGAASGLEICRARGGELCKLFDSKYSRSAQKCPWKLVAAAIVNRHGSRTPAGEKALLAEWPTNARAKSLTALGLRESQELGSCLARRYGHLTLHNDTLEIAAATSSRTLDTANGILQGWTSALQQFAEECRRGVHTDTDDAENPQNGLDVYQKGRDEPETGELRRSDVRDCAEGLTSASQLVESLPLKDQICVTKVGNATATLRIVPNERYLMTGHGNLTFKKQRLVQAQQKIRTAMDFADPEIIKAVAIAETALGRSPSANEQAMVDALKSLYTRKKIFEREGYSLPATMKNIDPHIWAIVRRGHDIHFDHFMPSVESAWQAGEKLLTEIFHSRFKGVLRNKYRATKLIGRGPTLHQGFEALSYNATRPSTSPPTVSIYSAHRGTLLTLLAALPVSTSRKANAPLMYPAPASWVAAELWCAADYSNESVDGVEVPQKSDHQNQTSATKRHGLKGGRYRTNNDAKKIKVALHTGESNELRRLLSAGKSKERQAAEAEEWWLDQCMVRWVFSNSPKCSAEGLPLKMAASEDLPVMTIREWLIYFDSLRSATSGN